MYFMRKEEKVFHKYIKIWEKVSKIVKKNLIVKLSIIKEI